MAGVTGGAVVAVVARVESLRRSRLAIVIAVFVMVILTIVLVSFGVLGDPEQVTAYATVILAIGTIGLAVGAIGTYVEQRDTNRQQAEQLDAAKVADMAQIMIHRKSGPGEELWITVANGSHCSIREIYVWAQVARVTDIRFPAVVMNKSSMGRGMKDAPYGAYLRWQYRAILPRETVEFKQPPRPAGHPLPPSAADTDITAFAEFVDARGQWWRIDEDGNVAAVAQQVTAPPMRDPIDAGQHVRFR